MSELLQMAQAFVDRKYVARADERQKSMGLAYVEAERQDLAREVARFAKSVTSIVAAPEWQLIETAPKDGRHVMLAVTDDGPGDGYVAEGYYEQDDDRGWFASNTHWTDHYDGQLWPSYWQPLPAPPTQNEVEKRTKLATIV